ncbi:hypothetical protein TNCV_226991 [Trichonephila clavipes]|nr:hypothetical protein TNCV_226991 [Trichonephila clavipes]
MNHSELPFVQGELRHHFKERNRARKLRQFTIHPQHKTELNGLQNTIKRKVGLNRQQVWEDSLDAPFGELKEHPGRRLPRSQPLMALTAGKTERKKRKENRKKEKETRERGALPWMERAREESPGWNGREESAKEKGLVRDWSGKTMNAGGVENRI